MDIFTEVKAGKISEVQMKRLLDEIARVDHGYVHIYVGRKRPKSVQQRGYYRGYILPEISKFTGYTEEEAHEEMKKLFLLVPILDEMGNEEMMRIKSTEELNSTETEEYYLKIRRHWDLLGLHLAEPTHAGF